MHRRSFIQHASVGIGALTLLQQNLLASFFEDPWKITMLNKDMGVFTEKGGTILFYLSKDGIVVVDAQFPEQSKHLIDELKKQSTQPFNLLINTHHHSDHSSGNISFKGLVPHVLAHENSLKNQQRVAIAQKAEDKQLYPDRTFGSVWSEKIGSETVSLHYFGAAHTDGDALIHFEKANIVHVGDLVNNRRYPYVDRSAGASVRNWVNVLDKTTKSFGIKTTFVFGHASEGFEVYGKREDINKMKDYFEKLLKFTEDAIKSGKSKEEFIKSAEIPGVTEFKGDGVQRSLTAAYDELTEK